MLEFEVAGDRINFIDLQKSILEIKCKKVQASDSDLNNYAGAAADVTKQTLLTFVIMLCIHSFLTVQR